MRKLEKTSVFTKDLKKLPEEVQRDAWNAAKILMQNIFDKRLEIKKLEGYKGVWRVTIRKNYRMAYTFDKETIYLLRIRHRKDIYRKNITL